MGVKVEKLYMTYVDGVPVSFVPWEDYERAKMYCRGWMDSKATAGKTVRLVELSVTRVLKLKGAKK